MRPQAAIAVVVLLVAVCLAALTGTWIASAATLASAALLAWVVADTVKAPGEVLTGFSDAALPGLGRVHRDRPLEPQHV